MSNTINFGIDLGTTNSTIAKFIKGEVEIFSNPRDYGRNTLPSVVAFRKDKIIVGSKAKERLEKDPKNVVSVFKRKMGTAESFNIKSIGKSKTPIELSSLVLKELKTFVPSDNNLEATVITIPSSFDTIQSNATKEAGIQSGFKQVVLLQEPIAASLAYANKTKENDLSDGQWLVYDLGGGTFDVALVKIQNGEMKVLDHEGDNFLGGADFDQLIVEKLVIPHLESNGSFQNLKEDMQSASGKHNGAYYLCLNKAEIAKIELSASTSAEIELIIDDDNGDEVDTMLTITRSEFESLLKEYLDGTVNMVKKILTRNSLTPQDLQFTLMIGGSTYIPYVRKRVEELVGVKVNTDIDPTTAVAIGAAYYAGTKQIDFTLKKPEDKDVRIKVKMAYQKATKESDEFFAARIEGDLTGLQYRIDREDGGFTTGLKPLTKQISEELPLVESSYNFFTLTVYDDNNNVVLSNAESIGINSGYAVSGQPLPNDICIEIDDYDNVGKTKLELIFEKNNILPAKKTVRKNLNKTIVKGSDESIVINILEGSQLSLPESNLSIGFVELTGTMISRDLNKGSDIELTIQISESRDLTVTAYLTMLDQEFKQVFNPKERHVPIEWLNSQVGNLSDELDKELNQALEREDYETAEALKNAQSEMKEIISETELLTTDDVTDKRYQIEDKKRKLAQEIDNATKDKRLQESIIDYEKVKEKCEALIHEYGNDYEKKAYSDIVKQEIAFLSSSNYLKIKDKADDLHTITIQVLWRKPEFLIGIYKHLLQEQSRMNNQEQARSLIEAGKFATQSENWERLAEVNHSLMNLLPHGRSEEEIVNKIGF